MLLPGGMSVPPFKRQKSLLTHNQFLKYAAAHLFGERHMIVITAHIENRRLLGAASGSLVLEEDERNHLHTCEVCQGVFFVLVNQSIATPTPPPNENTPGA